jgi:hypothetical protein
VGLASACLFRIDAYAGSHTHRVTPTPSLLGFSTSACGISWSSDGRISAFGSDVGFQRYTAGDLLGVELNRDRGEVRFICNGQRIDGALVTGVRLRREALVPAVALLRDGASVRLHHQTYVDTAQQGA